MKGVTSPFLAATSRKSSVSRLATPELPLLEAANELLQAQAFDPLPLAALDANSQEEECEDSIECRKNEFSTPATCAESTASCPESETTYSSPGNGTRSPIERDLPSLEGAAFEKNTFLEFRGMDECLESDDDEPRQRPRAHTDFSGLLKLRARDINAVPRESLKDGYRFQRVESAEGSKKAGEQSHGNYVALWCRTQQIDGGTLVFPCPDMPVYSEDVYRDHGPYVGYGEGPSVSFTALWCYQHHGPEGIYVVPYTSEGIASSIKLSDKLSAVEACCAPLAPQEGAYVPEWNFGPCWPFNVEPTTLLLRNLPPELSQEALIEVLDKEDFCGFYDLVFMPLDLSTGLNLGHAMVNLSRHSYGLALAARLHGRTKWGVGYEMDACKVIWSHEGQGLQFLVEQFRNAAENSDEVPEEFRPQLFREGWPTPFPRPSTLAPCHA